jgi:hypothetical protein
LLSNIIKRNLINNNYELTMVLNLHFSLRLQIFGVVSKRYNDYSHMSAGFRKRSSFTLEWPKWGHSHWRALKCIAIAYRATANIVAFLQKQFYIQTLDISAKHTPTTMPENPVVHEQTIIRWTNLLQMEFKLSPI